MGQNQSMSGSFSGPAGPVRVGKNHFRNISSQLSNFSVKDLVGDAPSSPTNRDRSPSTSSDEPPPFAQIKHNQKVGRLLASVPILARLDRKQRAQLGGALTRRMYKEKEVIMKEGDEADGFYIIKRGEVKVVAKDAEGQDVEVGRLKAGDYFGERALLTPGTKRNATVETILETKCFYLDKQYFLDFFKGHNQVMFAKREAVLDGGGFIIPTEAQKMKDEETINKLANAVANNPLFRSLDERHKVDICKEMYKISVKKDTPLIKQHDRGDTFYVIADKGEVKVLVDGEEVTSTGPWTCFGELALLYNAPRAASCIATQDTDLWMVDRHTFRRIAKDISQARLDKYVRLLEKISDLAPLASFEREKVAGALGKKVYEEGKTIFEQDDQADAMYIIQSGEVEMIIMDKGVKKVVKTHKAGGYFGEKALLKGTPRAMTAVAVQPTKLLRLDRNDFHLLLGPLEDIMKRPSLPVIPVPIPRNSFDRDKPQKPEVKEKEPGPEREDVDINKLEVITLLGKGAFGRVKLVRDTSSSKTYALKVVNKALVVRARQEIHIMGEKNIMAQLNHPFIVHLYKTFMDKDTLYFLMEVCLGGDFFGYLRERFNFSENEGRFYAGCVVLLLEYLHSKDIIYRDLKPENLLIDPRGYLKMIDFGFATCIGNGRTHTLCGTPDYMAPEIVMSKGHGKGVDCWTLGVLIFEMQAGYPPFYDQDPMKQYQKIRQGHVECPSHFSPSLRDLVLGLLQLEPHKRLGNGLNGWERARAHPWFKGFSWEKLLKQKYKAPYTPKLKGSTDVSNFHKYPTPQEDIVPFKETADRWEKDFGPMVATGHLAPGTEVPA
eukprot:gb/GEZN01001848.1/.p1 GENE.gb/GEZN01001848.1/~~gb/GEZN01001848.1/.p1  ORF type:complete len:833 (-),score=119.81 gb/GEZN01001848.1/:203-2701(-)